MSQIIPKSDNNQDPYIFPQGLAGFGSAHAFGFIYAGTGDLVCMQSFDQVEASFILTAWDDERLGCPPHVSQDQLHCLDMTRQQLEAGDDVLWMLVLNPFADSTWVTANIRAPILLNTVTRRGIQCIQHDTTLALRYHWMKHPTAPALTAANA
ncbi:MAG: flagellar assembly protein FliW [Zetaproteobacteria bacterium]|nr:flagellar assembly protein FliW [Zetaproteobacteria bacterium]